MMLRPGTFEITFIRGDEADEWTGGGEVTFEAAADAVGGFGLRSSVLDLNLMPSGGLPGASFILDPLPPFYTVSSLNSLNNTLV